MTCIMMYFTAVYEILKHYSRVNALSGPVVQGCFFSPPVSVRGRLAQQVPSRHGVV